MFTLLSRSCHAIPYVPQSQSGYQLQNRRSSTHRSRVSKLVAGPAFRTQQAPGHARLARASSGWFDVSGKERYVRYSTNTRPILVKSAAFFTFATPRYPWKGAKFHKFLVRFLIGPKNSQAFVDLLPRTLKNVVSRGYDSGNPRSNETEDIVIWENK